MSTLLSDTFTGADGTELNGRALAVGGTWACAAGNGIFAIVSNKADADATNNRLLMVQTPAGETDYVASLDYTLGTDADRGRGLQIRCDDNAATNGFNARPRAGTEDFALLEGGTLRASSSVTIGAETGAIDATCNGATITAHWKGANEISYGSAATTGRSWVGTRHGQTSDRTDNFLVTTVSSPVTVTPGVVALTTTKFAPTVSTPRLVTPATLALASTKFAPTVSTPRLVTPSTLALAMSASAPTVLTPRTVTPSTLALVTAAFAPAANVTLQVVPGTVALQTSALAPTISMSAHVRVTPDALALALSTSAPSALAPRLVTPGLVALATSLFAPAVSTPRVVTPPSLPLTATGLAPTIAAPRLVVPSALALALSTFAPTAGASLRIEPSVRALLLAMFGPTVTSTTVIRVGACIEVSDRPAAQLVLTDAPVAVLRLAHERVVDVVLADSVCD